MIELKSLDSIPLRYRDTEKKKSDRVYEDVQGDADITQIGERKP